MPERSGLVTELTAPEAGRKQGHAKVGGRKVWFFWTDFNSETPSQVRQRLEKAQREAFPVLATGEERPNPQSSEYPIFTAKAVERAAEAPQNGSQSPQQAPTATDGSAPHPKPGHHPLGFIGADPGLADFWLAMRWAWSLAAELLPKMGTDFSSLPEGETPVTAIAQLAGEIFHTSYVQASQQKEQIDSGEVA